MQIKQYSVRYKNKKMNEHLQLIVMVTLCLFDMYGLNISFLLITNMYTVTMLQLHSLL